MTILTAGTDKSTCSPTIWRRLAAARLTPIFAISASASRSISESSLTSVVIAPVFSDGVLPRTKMLREPRPSEA